MKKMFIIFTLTTALLIMSAAAAAAQDLTFSGYARNTTGVLLNDNMDFSQVQNTLNLSAEYYGDTSDFKADVYLNQNGLNDIEAGVKELYLDILFDSMDLRIGKQQIIWGKADGAFITDVVSPKNLSNFILPDFDEIRMGVTGVKADVYLGSIDLELVWLPAFTPAVMPSGIWAVPMTLPNGTPITPTITTPDETLGNSEYFGKLSYMGSAIDLELMGAYMWDDLPALTFDQMDGSTPLFDADYYRLTMVGGSFSTDLAGLIIKGEGAYYKDKSFTSVPSASPADIAVIKKDYINYMIGLDYSIAGIMLGTQFLQEYIIDYSDTIMMNNEFKNTMTFVVAKSFLNETLKLKVFSYVGLGSTDYLPEDALLRFSAAYDIADGLEWVVGSDIFLGDSGDFGQYNDNDMVYTKVKYSF